MVEYSPVEYSFLGNSIDFWPSRQTKPVESIKNFGTRSFCHFAGVMNTNSAFNYLIIHQNSIDVSAIQSQKKYRIEKTSFDCGL